MGWYSYYSFFPKSRPRAVKGGIKAQSKRGNFGETWWAKRWIGVLESFDIGARLGRGRSYARNGQVVSIDVDKGCVTAKVQGSRPKPYAVKIKIQPIASTDWKKLAKQLSTQAIFAAKLLAGEMPQDIETAFREANLSLFPSRLKDLETNCSCPDWSNPCKHIAAVYYLLGEEFDRDPFLIFKLRGLTREELVNLMDSGGRPSVSKAPSVEPRVASKGRGRRRKTDADQAAPQPASVDDPLDAGAQSTPATVAEPLPMDPSAFWNGASLPDDFFGEVMIPPVHAALPKRLGSFPFWRGQTRFLDAIEPTYEAASARGLEVFLGQRQLPPT